MDGSKFVIIGANGQLGKALRQKYPGAQAVDSNQLDIADKNSVKNFDWSNTTHILNAAAYTNVDGAESYQGRKAAWAVNSSGAANLAKISSEQDKILVHISSDYVFDGSEKEHAETEVFSPLSVYGASKAAGDIAISLAPNHYIVRSSWVIGDGNNFVRTMMSLAEKNISPKVVHDQIGRLTFTSELVSAIDHLLSLSSPSGIYNVSNSGEPASWADITRSIFELVGRSDLTVSNTTTTEYYEGKTGIAPRPFQSTLDLTKIQQTGFQSTNWQTGLKNYIKGETQ